MELAIFTENPHFAVPQQACGPIVEEETQKRFHQLAGEAFATNQLTGNGPMATCLEEAIAERHDVAHAVATASGTLAQMLLLKALGLESGEALISANTFVATAHACAWQGLRPVFCDINPQTLNIDPAEVERKFTDDTVAVIPTHIFGVFADMPALDKLCRQKGLLLLADAAHAFDCDQGGVRAGGHGVPEFFSLDADMYFSTIEGGVIVTNDSALARELRHLRHFGYDLSGQAGRVGLNAHLSEIHAAFGLASLPSLEQRREQLLAVREIYYCGLAGLPGVAVHPVDAAGRNNYRYFALRLEEAFGVPRNAVLEALRRENVQARAYFAPGCHRISAYWELGEEVLPRVEGELGRLLCLPTSFRGVDPFAGAQAVVDLLREIHDRASEVCDWWKRDGAAHFSP